MFELAQLRALAAIVNEGSFDAAARVLNITPPAISQRIRALEETAGTTLLIRSQPVRTTEAGQKLYQHAQTVALLEQGLLREFAPIEATNHIAARARIAVNADSLDTWFIPVLARAQADSGLLFDVISDDQDHTAERLRQGEVQAAVTTHGQAITGCDSMALGSLRYIATCSPDFAAKWFPDGVTHDSLAQAPALEFDRKDSLQTQWAARECAGRAPVLRSHMLPSTKGFVFAAQEGLGWGMNPEYLVRPKIEAGQLLALGTQPELDTPLFWQISRITVKALRPLTRAVTAFAKEHLVQSK